jgi:hypothetical protein
LAFLPGFGMGHPPLTVPDVMICSVFILFDFDLRKRSKR